MLKDASKNILTILTCLLFQNGVWITDFFYNTLKLLV